MEPRRFLAYNVAGGLGWSAAMLLGGFWLGRIAWVRDHLSLLSIAIVAVSVVPVGIQWLRARRPAAQRSVSAPPGSGS
jgi:membrane-associated protein